MIAAIGLQLLLCSIATAGDSIDRSARRLPAQVAQAFRDIVDRSVTQQHTRGVDLTPGYRLGECPRGMTPSVVQFELDSGETAWARQMLNLPPPAGC